LRAHGGIDGGEIVPLTESGEVTVRWLDINHQTRVEIRATLAQPPFYPRRSMKESKRTAKNSWWEIGGREPYGCAEK